MKTIFKKVKKFASLHIILFFTITLICCIKVNINNGSNEVSERSDSGSKVLSRRKRFIVFPEGSSVQLVFCVQSSALIPIGDIFLFGSTASLAWMLPTDPTLLEIFKKHKKVAQRKEDSENIHYLDVNGKIIAKVTNVKRMKNPTIVFVKRSIEKEKTSFKKKLELKINRLDMHRKRIGRNFLRKKGMKHTSLDFHRNSRVGLYGKIESLLDALGHNGRQCVLYKLCESAQYSLDQGSFKHELLRIVFTLPKGKVFLREEHKDYDIAHTASRNCSEIYPECEAVDFQLPIMKI